MQGFEISSNERGRGACTSSPDCLTLQHRNPKKDLCKPSGDTKREF
jgi:hypothetical protein